MRTRSDEFGILPAGFPRESARYHPELHGTRVSEWPREDRRRSGGATASNTLHRG